MTIIMRKEIDCSCCRLSYTFLQTTLWKSWSLSTN
jgi:hypothetical protein